MLDLSGWTKVGSEKKPHPTKPKVSTSRVPVLVTLWPIGQLTILQAISGNNLRNAHFVEKRTVLNTWQPSWDLKIK